MFTAVNVSTNAPICLTADSAGNLQTRSPIGKGNVVGLLSPRSSAARYRNLIDAVKETSQFPWLPVRDFSRLGVKVPACEYQATKAGTPIVIPFFGE
jgi:hypothetical protein